MKTEKELEDIKNSITEHVDKLAHLIIEEFSKIEDREIQANYFSNLEGKLSQLIAICASTIPAKENRHKLTEFYAIAIKDYADNIREKNFSIEDLYSTLKKWMDIPKKNDILKLLIATLAPVMNSIPSPMPKINKDQIN